MPIIVAARGSAEENAYFYIAWRISGVLFGISASVSGCLLAEGAHDSRQLMGQVRQSAVLISALLVCPVAFLIFLGHRVLALFGATYAAHSYIPLLLFLVVAAPDAVTNIYVTVLRVKGEHHIGVIVNLLMSVSAIVLAWMLLPRMGVAAAGWSWAAGQMIGVLFMGFAMGARVFSGFSLLRHPIRAGLPARRRSRDTPMHTESTPLPHPRLRWNPLDVRRWACWPS